jgi:hypothetical protein
MKEAGQQKEGFHNPSLICMGARASHPWTFLAGLFIHRGWIYLCLWMLDQVLAFAVTLASILSPLPINSIT